MSVTGGKLTTYRKMAEDTVDQVLAPWGRPGTRPVRDGDAPPGRSTGASSGDRPGAGRATLAHLWARYGSDARPSWPWPTTGPSCSSR